ncbi:hypothetical protein FRB90_010130, partial [Tulasnella sp. 427]
RSSEIVAPWPLHGLQTRTEKDIPFRHHTLRKSPDPYKFPLLLPLLEFDELLVVPCPLVFDILLDTVPQTSGDNLLPPEPALETISFVPNDALLDHSDNPSPELSPQPPPLQAPAGAVVDEP